ncbi:cation diffusion facilitator family transporter [Alkanindiges illinoisensis]|uniref:cation diffusion facilitator family transporter n=1 Tax=Alkanindiges illinoisensis TaxID=197183 RepID=UPI0009FE0976|nr:cation diffusion facilitator family transporter [Alkanindiges illinoisensis]
MNDSKKSPHDSSPHNPVPHDQHSHGHQHGKSHNHSHHHNHNHDHAISGQSHSKRLWWALGLTSSFLLIEVIGGLLTQSLALLSDAAHMFTDTAALAIALAAIQIAKRPADQKRTFGYHRFEILAAAFNAILLFIVAFYIVYEAWLRIQQPPEIQSTGMLGIAVIGLLINLLAMYLLVGGQKDSLNVKGAYLEVLSDALGSLGVIVGALIIMFTGWLWVDSMIAVAIGFWVLPRTWVLLRDSLNILLEGVPANVSLDKISADLKQLDGVAEVHDLHVWALTSGKSSLTAHLVVPSADIQQVLENARQLLAQRHQLHHITLQCERISCAMAESDAHQFLQANQSASQAGHGNSH